MKLERERESGPWHGWFVGYVLSFFAVAEDGDSESMTRPIYLDYNATTPMAPEVSYAVAEAW